MNQTTRVQLDLYQPALPTLGPVQEAVATMASAGAKQRGAIFTKRAVAEFILDLVEYTPERPLHQFRLLEPSVGEGDFLLPALDRLLKAWRSSGSPPAVAALSKAIRGIELHVGSLQTVRKAVIQRLTEEGLTGREAEILAANWIIHGDFLLTPLDSQFDFVVGNPPYVRQELIPDAVMAAYRARYKTIYDRADIYIPFIEQSLQLLSKKGVCGFICSDRWMKNRYGGPLRALVARDFYLKIYVDMVDTAAFHADVVAYPAITVISREDRGVTRVAHRPKIEESVLYNLARQLTGKDEANTASIKEMHGIVIESEPWLLESSDELALIRRLEAGFPLIEDAGCKVGIGVATGADKVFIGNFDELDVEESRKLRLAMTRDINDGHVKWRGLGVINPFGDDGRLVDLNAFPRLHQYLEQRRKVIDRRHVAQKAPLNWYRTIDRIYPELAARPKLLIPDIKGQAHIVYEDGRLYPHHNLYFITSDSWNIRALQAVLMSGIARLFVSTYSTKMRGGYLRFQAQYLRRIRLPEWQCVSQSLQRRLIDAAESQDMEACNTSTFDLYELSQAERATLGGNGN